MDQGCRNGLGSETPAKASNPRFLQKRALSFQKEFSYEEKDDPAKKNKDIGVSLTASLPKVSELRKRFEGITTTASDWEMNRKERLARRLDGIDGEVHPSLLPNLVANQVVCLLPEDTPRYTRASDLCEPHAVQRYGLEGFENPDAPVKPPDRESRGRYSSDTQSSIHTEPVHSSGSTTAAPEQESKAERIARYKAERRRQLAERYGISLDQDLDLDYASRYTRTRNESDNLERRKRELGELLKEEGRDITRVYSSTAVSSPKSGSSATPHSRHDPVYDVARTRLDSFSERERLMNLENQRRAAPSESTSTSSYMDVTSSQPKVPAKDSVASLPPSSPKMSRHSSLASPKHAASPGDVFIEQQAQSILSRQGIKVRERLAREEGHQRNPELENLAELSGYHRQLQHRPQSSAPIRYNRERAGPQQAYFQSYHDPQSHFSRSSHQGGEDIGGYLSYLSMASGPTCRAEQEQEKRVCQDETEEPEGVKTEGLLRSRKAVLPSEIRRRERSTEDPQRGKSEEEMGLSSMYSLSQAQVASAEEHARSGVIGRARTEKSEHSTCLQAAEWRPRGQQNVIYVHKGPTATHIHPNTLHAIHGTSASRTAFNPLVSDVGTNQRNIQHQLQDYRVQECEGDGNGEGHQDRRVSVDKLRHSYMESTTTPPSRRRNELDIEGQREHGGYQAPWRGVRERGHQPLHYICPGESRKTSERFRTQPITSAERQETNRSCVSSHVASTDADEEKLDERAKLSVAAKRSLFR
ncbi:hypothetical protein CRENBAI_009823, partial [Crenichthys baileyi]